MREIMYWVHRQEEADREIAAQIPAIARQSERENAPKGGFLPPPCFMNLTGAWWADSRRMPGSWQNGRTA